MYSPLVWPAETGCEAIDGTSSCHTCESSVKLPKIGSNTPVRLQASFPNLCVSNLVESCSLRLDPEPRLDKE